MRFEDLPSKVALRVREDESGCWEATSGLRADGYATVNVRTPDDDKWTTTTLHRYVYTLAGREIPDGWHVDHLCRNHACCNPAHLEAVTRAENARRGVVSRLAEGERRPRRPRHEPDRPTTLHQSTGLYSTKEAMRLAGTTFRQLDYWDRSGLLKPTVPANGSGTRRFYSASDVLRARAIRIASSGFTSDVVTPIASAVQNLADAELTSTVSVPLGDHLSFQMVLDMEPRDPAAELIQQLAEEAAA